MSEAHFNLLRNMPVFGALNNDTLQLICDESDVIEVTAGDYFFRQGDRANSLFVLQQGVVVVERLWNDTTIVLGRLQRGDCIGEMSLIDLMPRSASVRAEEDCQAIEITLSSLHKLYQQELEQYAIIMMNMGREVSRRLRVADDRLFALEQKTPELIS
jgi:CRP/FNR family cyclic AMP-dependent transcriptional regulator